MGGEFSKYASVILDLAINTPLDYGIPAALEHVIQRGVQVKVPVRGHLRKGYVYALKETSSFTSVLPIVEVLSSEALIPHDLFELGLWMGKYYCASLSQVFKILLPASVRGNVSHKHQCYVIRSKSKESLREECQKLQEEHPPQAKVLEVMLLAKKGIFLTELMEKAGVSKSPIDSLVKKGFLSLDTIRVDRSPLIGEEYFRTEAKSLNLFQKEALDRITATLEKTIFETHLLYGITGSGKTEVYLQAIGRALQLGRGTIMLVPEISLTAQTIERFRSRFEGSIAILHHRLSPGERFDEWHRIHRGEAQIVIGARSAIFSPVRNLGLIIVDEEHDGAYKQSEESPCYHARDVAVMRGKMTQSAVVLGSATPSLESYFNAENGKYQLSVLPGRAEVASLPRVTIVDMKKEFDKAKGYTTFSDALIEGIKKRLALGEQTLLFLNRRGYHTSLLCKACGHVSKCPHCDLSLTFHLGENLLSCHLCDYRLSPPPTVCSQCKTPETLKFRGIGTEHVERALHAILPEARTLRVDGDTTRHKGSHEKLFREFGTGKSDVLIGTQMIAKGLHFPAVTLVAILNSDAGLQIPDFRASEHSFQMITQVAGRSGRGELPGEVFIQTQLPENHTIQMAAAQNFPSFYSSEKEIRQLFGYPPYSHFVKLIFSGPDAQQTQEIGTKMRASMVAALGHKYVIHPLTPAGHPKIKDIYRFQFLIRGVAIYPINEAYEKLILSLSFPKSVRIAIDVDPSSTFF